MLASVIHASDEDVASENKIHIRDGIYVHESEHAEQCWPNWEVKTIFEKSLKLKNKKKI